MVLLSGGLDSTTALAVARSAGYELYAMSFRYGQRHSLELESASRVASAIGVEKHLIANFDLRAIGGSALTDQIEVPKERGAEEIASGIPVTYVPARNTIFLSFALAWAEVLGAQDIFIGVNLSTTAATLIAGQSTSNRSKEWRILRRRRALKDVCGSRFTRHS